GLDDDGVANLIGDLGGLVFILDGALGAGEDGHLGGLGGLLALALVAEFGHGLRAGADELDAAVAADLGKVGPLGEEAVAGVDGIDIGDLSSADDAADVQVGIASGPLADADGPIRQPQIRRPGVGGRVDADALDAHLAAGAD